MHTNKRQASSCDLDTDLELTSVSDLVTEAGRLAADEGQEVGGATCELDHVVWHLSLFSIAVWQKCDIALCRCVF